MCPKCQEWKSVLYSMSVGELLDYANRNRSSPAAAHGRLDAAIEILQKMGGCASCIRELENTKQSIF